MHMSLINASWALRHAAQQTMHLRRIVVFHAPSEDARAQPQRWSPSIRYQWVPLHGSVALCPSSGKQTNIPSDFAIDVSVKALCNSQVSHAPSEEKCMQVVRLDCPRICFSCCLGGKSHQGNARTTCDTIVRHVTNKTQRPSLTLLLLMRCHYHGFCMTSDHSNATQRKCHLRMRFVTPICRQVSVSVWHFYPNKRASTTPTPTQRENHV